MIVARWVTEEQLRARLARLEVAAPNVQPAGVDDPPPGSVVHDDARVVGHGDAAWERLAAALRRWDLHREAGMLVAASGDVAPGVSVVNAAPFGSLRVLVPCRVLALVDEPRCSGFDYVTLPGNPVAGVERFSAHLAEDGAVTLRLRSWSRPSGPARAFPPALRFGQWLGNRRYLDAGARICGS